MSDSPVHKLIMAFLSESSLEDVSKSHFHSPIIKVFKKNEVIFREGEEAKAIFLLWKGKVILVKKKGDPQMPTLSILDTLERGDLLGLVDVLSSIVYTSSGIAAAKVQTFEILKDDFLQFVSTHPTHQLTIAKQLSRKIIYYESILSMKS